MRLRGVGVAIQVVNYVQIIISFSGRSNLDWATSRGHKTSSSIFRHRRGFIQNLHILEEWRWMPGVLYIKTPVCRHKLADYPYMPPPFSDRP